jgi:hypothetical protein
VGAGAGYGGGKLGQRGQEGLAIQAQAGLLYPISDRTSLTAGYRLLGYDIAEVNHTDGTTLVRGQMYFQHALLLGLRYTFGIQGDRERRGVALSSSVADSLRGGRYPVGTAQPVDLSTPARQDISDLRQARSLAIAEGRDRGGRLGGALPPLAPHAMGPRGAGAPITADLQRRNLLVPAAPAGGLGMEPAMGAEPGMGVQPGMGLESGLGEGRPVPLAPPPSAASVAGRADTAGASRMLSGGFGVQVGSYRSRGEAGAAWNQKQQEHGGLLRGLQPRVQEVQVPGKGRWYRLYAAGLDRAGADRVCAEIRARGTWCAVSALGTGA